MLFKLKLHNKESGQAIVIIALIMAVLMGIAALVIDVARVSVVKAKMQNAVDSSALAAAQDLPDTTKAIETMNQYIKENGYTEDDIENYTFSNSNNRIDITVAKDINYTFAKVIGFDKATIKVNAAAKKYIKGGEAFDYAVFAGGGPASFNGSKHVFGGGIYGRDGVSLGNKTTVDGDVVCTSNGSINEGNNTTINGSVIENSPPIPMPDLSEQIEEQGIICSDQADFYSKFNGKTINGPVYVNGNLTINGRIKGNGIIYASGTITFLDNNILQTYEDSICFYAAQGDITFNGGSGVVIGILYAPNGTIRVNGAPNSKTYGRIIAKEVDVNGEGASVYASPNDLIGLNTLTNVKLVK